MRHKLQEERASITHKFKVGDHEGYITVGLYPNGEPGELFITMAKEGSTVSGLMDSFALAVSIALQHGVPLELFCEKFAHTRFEPSGWSRQSRHRLRQVDHGLHLPLAAAALPDRPAADAVRESAAEGQPLPSQPEGRRSQQSAHAVAENREPGARELVPSTPPTRSRASSTWATPPAAASAAAS